jgi:hypothetical protein
MMPQTQDLYGPQLIASLHYTDNFLYINTEYGQGLFMLYHLTFHGSLFMNSLKYSYFYNQKKYLYTYMLM